MHLTPRVIWSEGMHLAPHHFQTQNRYVEQAVAFSMRHLFANPYGLVAGEFDPEALLNGTVTVVSARGILPDGTLFDFPDSDPAPPPRAIRDVFSPTHDAHEICLVLPAHRPGSANTAEPEAASGEHRYLPREWEVPDETTGQDDQVVTVGQRNFSLRLDTEVPASAVSLPLARIRRDRGGHFVYDPDFVPACLQVGASRRLLQLVHSLIEILESKAAALGAERRGPREAQGEWASQEVAGFWLSNAILASLPSLRHHLATRTTSPEQLYLDLAKLAGALCTFALESDPTALPAYDHARPEAGFLQLETHIRTHLEITRPTNAIVVPLRPYPHYRNIWVGAVLDDRALHHAEWVLGVRATGPMADLITDVPRLVKVCGSQPSDVPAADSFIVKLVKRAHPGLLLEHLASPPSAIGPRLGTLYFRIGQTGPCWDAVGKVKGVGVYAPDTLRDPEFELIAVLRSS